MKYCLLLVILFLNSCVTVDENIDGKIKHIKFSICYWNTERLTSKKVKEWTGKKNIFSVIAANCDSFSLTNIKVENETISDDIETLLSKEGLNYSCADSINFVNENNLVLNETKYLNCANSNKVIEVKVLDFPDFKRDFLSPPSSFFLELTNGVRISVLPFFSKQGSKRELIDFEKIVNFIYQKYSERKSFFGGTFYTDKKYHSDSFLSSLLYFKILKNLISESASVTGEKNDIILTDNVTSLNCIGKVLTPAKLTSDNLLQKELELISDHYPTIANCKVK